MENIDIIAVSAFTFLVVLVLILLAFKRVHKRVDGSSGVYARQQIVI